MRKLKVMNRSVYLLAFTIPASVLLSLEGYGSFIALGYAFGALPLLELFLPAPVNNKTPAEEASALTDPFFDLFLYLMVPIQSFLVFRFCAVYSHAPEDWATRLGLITALGVSCGVLGINVAHELGHRKKSYERIFSRMLLATSLNWQFYIEHNRGHHKNVSTPQDPESARLNETLYSFWIRAVRDSFRNAWKLDRRELSLGLFVESALLVAIGWNFGLATMVAFFASAVFGILLLQSVNYIEHYGLARKEIAPGRFEAVSPAHSWNANQVLSRAILFELSRHSDHHAHASRKYPLLRHHSDSPQMPTGYPGMILLALIPPMWRRVIHKRI
jgi:alkane 1-monooxygenase